MAAIDFVAGCFGGVAGLIVGHPFDTLKVHMQTQDFRNPQYRSTFHCMTSIAAKESLRGFYRGISSPMAGVSVINAIVFGVYGNIQRYSSNPNSYTSHFLAGSTAGLVQSFICSPMELAKTRLQLQVNMLGSSKFHGPTQCLKFVYQCEGMRGVFKGLSATAIRDVPGFALYFVSYEWLIRMRQDPSIPYTLFAGGMAGIFSWVLTIPVDVVKSRLQIDGMTGERPAYNGMIDCFRKSYHAEGLPFFTRGLSSTLLRAFPMNAVCFMVVNSTLKYYNENIVKSNAKSTTTKTAHLVNTIRKTNENHCHKRRIFQGLLYIGAFSEAVCSSEIIEIANDWYNNNAILFSNEQTNFALNHEQYLQPNL